MRKIFLILIFSTNFSIMNAQISLTERINTNEAINVVNLNTLTGVFLKKGDFFKVDVKTAVEHQDLIKVENKNGEINIFLDSSKKVSNMNQLAIYITIPNKPITINAAILTDIQNDGEALILDNLILNLNTITTVNLNIISKNFDLKTTSVTNLYLHGSTDNGNINISNVTSSDLSHFIVKDLNLSINKIDKYGLFFATNHLTLEANGVKNTIIRGNPIILSNRTDESIITFEK